MECRSECLTPGKLRKKECADYNCKWRPYHPHLEPIFLVKACFNKKNICTKQKLEKAWHHANISRKFMKRPSESSVLGKSKKKPLKLPSLSLDRIMNAHSGKSEIVDGMFTQNN